MLYLQQKCAALFSNGQVSVVDTVDSDDKIEVIYTDFFIEQK